jgi:hypothetical protein
LEQKEHLKQLHEAYKALGGEDDADFLMKEVDKLPVSSDECP